MSSSTAKPEVQCKTNNLSTFKSILLYVGVLRAFSRRVKVPSLNHNYSTVLTKHGTKFRNSDPFKGSLILKPLELVKFQLELLKF